jgi:uncharacterized OB-fold protein
VATVAPQTLARPLPRVVGLTGEWYGWLKQHELRFQRCTGCARWRHLPRELCPGCSSRGWRWERSSGQGTVYTWSTTNRMLHPAFPDTPFAQVVVELEEGPRVISWVLGVSPSELVIGMPVQAEFDEVTADVTLIAFRPRTG